MALKREQSPDEGEVVYRRLSPDSSTPPASPRKIPRIDPTLIPLIVGFAILLLLVFLLGNLSVLRVEETSRRGLEMEQTHLARTRLLMQLRVALTKLDNEARDRMSAVTRRELRPPFDLRLDTARNQVSDQLDVMERAHLSDLPRWQRLRDRSE